MTLTHKRTFLTSLVALLISGCALAQQYPVFTQYYYNELVINPAYAGANVQLSATAMYRNQWVNFPGAPRTFNFSTHSSFMKNKIGLGLMINHDEIGSYKNQHIYFSYAYKLHFGKATLALGLQAGFNILGADFSDLELPGGPGSDEAFANAINKLKPNFGTGIYFSKKNYFIGLSVPFIINNNLATTSIENFAAQIKEARYYFLRGGAVFPIDRFEKVKFNPSFLLRTQEGMAVAFDANIAFIFYDVFALGQSFRFGDSFITNISLKLSDKIWFGYSYDWTQTELNRFSNGSHEFVLNFRSIIRGVHKNPECPNFYDYR